MRQVLKVNISVVSPSTMLYQDLGIRCEQMTQHCVEEKAGPRSTKMLAGATADKGWGGRVSKSD